MKTGERIRRLRERKQMTQSELAGECVSRNMLSLIENGRATPSIQTLEALAEKLKTTPAFLLADEREEVALLKQTRISDIRLAFSGKNYRIAADLCRRLYEEGMDQDDEIDLILSESLFETAKEILLSDRVREAARLFDETVFYAMRTVYYTDHLLSAVWTYFEYMGMLSPSLVSENLDETMVVDVSVAPQNDLFCRYIPILLSDGEQTVTLRAEDPPYARLMEIHLRVKSHMRAGEFEKALSELTEILRGEDILPGILMYHVFSDMEECCYRVGNTRNAELYRDLKVSQFEKLLS